MPISILPAEEADIPTIVRLQLAAFASHPRIPMQWPRGYTPDLYAYKEIGDRGDFQDAANHYWKAIDAESRAMVACADWSFHLSQAAEQFDGINERSGPPDDWPEGGNWELKRFYRLNTRRMIRDYIGKEPYIMLNVLTVLPEHQGRGAGKKLLTWGVEEADKLHVSMCLESTPAGLALYKQMGFVVREVVAANMHDFGWKEPYDEEAAHRIFMVREAR
nr:hypothetical protein B0A51_17067 [Rachicladosporium sp. CCFEE 5018]OQO19395.1 hypothetical protein B0A51_11269 [Rachicladosporium sp. CCFEE 5018]